MSLHSLETNQEYINLQTELVRLQGSINDQQQRLLIIFEGRDTAGKGGAIMRFVRFLNPRHYRIVALPKPTDLEKGQWYFQRYIEHLPNPGEVVFFDRSWYNRAVVEPVMGFCTEEQYQRFLEQVVQIEKMLVEDGMHLIKFWFSIDVEEQRKRLEDRNVNPLSQWKLSTVDALAQAKWDDFTRYKEAMFRATSKPECPWVIVKGNDKDLARMEAMRYVLHVSDFTRKGETGVRLQPEQGVVSLFDPCNK